MSNGSVCGTAPATLGLVISEYRDTLKRMVHIITMLTSIAHIYIGELKKKKLKLP